MGCSSVLGGQFEHLVATASGVGGLRYAPLTGWVQCTGLDKIRALLLLRALTGNFQGQLAIQTASVRTDKPDAWATLDTMTSADRCTGELDISATVASKLFVRFGVAFNLSSGTSVGEADVALQLSFNTCGALLGSVTMQLIAPDTRTYFVPIGEYIPVQQAAKLKYGVIVNSAANGFKHKVTYRAATVDPQVPTVAFATDSLDSVVSGDGERNTGELTLPVSGAASVSGKMWVQPGLGYSGSGAGAQATVTVIVASRS